MDGDAGFAGVYDAIYAGPAFLAAQLAFLDSAFSGISGPLLDAGCGTGRHLVPLSKRGYRVVGVDISPAMLGVARASLTEAGLDGALVRGDLRSLPFGPVFGGSLCLDSPLALILADDGLAAALTALHRSLCSNGVLVAEIFDYVGTLGAEPIAPWTSSVPALRGQIAIRESHRFDQAAGIWEMTQEFAVRRAARRESFAITHRLRMRSADAYAAALEAAGFRVEELLARYPGTPVESLSERRMIFVARRS
ncbi:MAG: class I SAM-dependent methyltransferase [Anaerolineae bacterium]|nr:class I SAM-dependent methyltransferase [Anaerolineae bacterium]